ncbi:symporter small accessory protein [Salibacterium sp. K-3]
MFGMESISALSGWLATILSAVFCVIYGLVNWNKGGED